MRHGIVIICKLREDKSCCGRPVKNYYSFLNFIESSVKNVSEKLKCAVEKRYQMKWMLDLQERRYYLHRTKGNNYYQKTTSCVFKDKFL